MLSFVSAILALLYVIPVLSQWKITGKGAGTVLLSINGPGFTWTGMKGAKLRNSKKGHTYLFEGYKSLAGGNPGDQDSSTDPAEITMKVNGAQKTLSKKDLIDAIKAGKLWFWNKNIEPEDRDTTWQSNAKGGHIAVMTAGVGGQDITLFRKVGSVHGTLRVPVGGKFIFKDKSGIHSPTYTGFKGGFQMKADDGTTSTWTEKELLSKKTKV